MPPPTDSHFTEHLAAARAGDRDAWTELYRAHAPAVLGFLRTQHPAAAEDLCADAFAGACRDIDQFTGDDEDFRRWILSIARNRLIDLRRADQRRPQTAGGDMPDQPFTDAGFATAEARADSTERIESLLGELAPDQRAVLYLRFVLDLDQRDVATVLKMSIASVKMAQLRGSRKLAQRMNSDRDAQ